MGHEFLPHGQYFPMIPSQANESAVRIRSGLEFQVIAMLLEEPAPADARGMIFGNRRVDIFTDGHAATDPIFDVGPFDIDHDIGITINQGIAFGGDQGFHLKHEIRLIVGEMRWSVQRDENNGDIGRHVQLGMSVGKRLGGALRPRRKRPPVSSVDIAFVAPLAKRVNEHGNTILIMALKKCTYHTLHINVGSIILQKARFVPKLRQ